MSAPQGRHESNAEYRDRLDGPAAPKQKADQGPRLKAQGHSQKKKKAKE